MFLKFVLEVSLFSKTSQRFFSIFVFFNKPHFFKIVMTRYPASEQIFKKITKNGIKFGEIKCTFEINRTRDFPLNPDPDAAFSGGTFFTWLFIFTIHKTFNHVQA